MPKLVKYSKIEKRYSLKHIKKIYEKNDYTVLYDVVNSNESINHHLLDDIKNLVIDVNHIKRCNISNISAKNIYFLNHPNMGGITIPYDFLKDDYRTYNLEWNGDNHSKIDKINIITSNGVKTINVSNLERLAIQNYKFSKSFSIDIIDMKRHIELTIDQDEKIDEIQHTYYLNQSDIKNDSIELKEFMSYDEIELAENFKVKNLIIDNTCMKDFYKFYDVFCDLKYDNLIINNNNQMKLIPNTIKLSNKNIKDIEIFQDFNKKFYILYKREMLIFLDNNDIKIIDMNKLNNEKKIENKKIYLEEFIGRQNPIMIIKYKHNKTEIIRFNITIKINKLFNIFCIRYASEYFYKNNIDEVTKLLSNNDWYTLFEKHGLNFNKLQKMYIDFLVFCDRIKNLHRKGFSYKAIRYFFENHFDNIIEGKYFDITDDEIEKFNDLGSIYVKRKKVVGIYEKNI